MLDSLQTQLAATSWVDWLAMLTGIVGVWLSIKEKIAAWPLFLVCYSCYIWISYQAGLYAFLGMNLVFIAISLYGLWTWSRAPQAEQAPLRVSRTRRAHWPIVLPLLLISTLSIAWLLNLRESSTLPYLDALATCCGFTAQWMLSRKHIETWLFWILSDLIYLGIFLKDAYLPGVLLFSTFIGLALKGWRDWRRILQNPPAEIPADARAQP